MATLTTKLTLTSSNLLTDALNLSITDSLTISGPTVQKTVVTSDQSAVVLAASSYTKSYVVLMNKSTASAEIITIEKSDGGDEYMTLGAGEFAFFPWTSSVNLFADSASGTPVA